MEATALTKIRLQPEQTAPQLWQVQQKDDETSSRKRQQPGGHGALVMLPEDQVTLSDTARTEQQQRSEPVSSREKAALLGSQKVTRFSIYG